MSVVEREVIIIGTSGTQYVAGVDFMSDKQPHLREATDDDLERIPPQPSLVSENT
jgi:hypothetical protein